MPTPEAHTPAGYELTIPFDNIVAGELQSARTFDPSELPDGAHLIPKDPTKPNLTHIANPELQAQDIAHKVGYISIDPDAPNIIVINDPDGEQRRVFSLQPQSRARIISWFVEQGYQRTSTATEHVIQRAPARHALRDSLSESHTLDRVMPVVSTPEKVEPVGLPREAESTRGWFTAPYQPAPYPATDTTRPPSARTPEQQVDAEAVYQPGTIVETLDPKPEPGDWREALQEKPLPMREQLVGVEHALAAVKSLLIGGKYNVTREQVEAAVEEVSDPARWHSAFPIQEFHHQEDGQVKPVFKPFNEGTKTVIQAALNTVAEITPTPEGLEERIWELTARPRHELTPDEERRLSRLQQLQRIAPVAEAIRKQPTILNLETPHEHTPESDDHDDHSGPGSTGTRLLPFGWFDAQPGHASAEQTTVLSPTAFTVAKQLTKKGINLVSQGLTKVKTKLKALFARNQIVSA